MTSDAATDPSTGSPGAEPAAVGAYLAQTLGDEAWRTPSVTFLAGGKSNLTYRVDSPAGSLVLRRPPLGHVLPTAHDMGREHRVLTALAGSAVPVPRTLALCTDEAVLGAPFYVMEHVEGHICRSDLPAGYADEPAQRRAIGDALVDVLAALHAVDPAAVGLEAHGRPEGYLQRQVKRWVTQWEATRLDGHEALDRLAERLAATVPATQRTSVVHGDYRLDNTILDPHQVGRIAAVLDWEMSTLGDPLADLGILLCYWTQEGDPTFAIPTATQLPGFPTRAEIADRYATATGLSVEALPWYQSFAFFKLAAVLAGIVARVEGGAMVGDGFEGLADGIGPLVARGTEVLDAGRVL